MKVVSSSVQGRVRITDEDVRKLYDERYGNAKPGARIRVLHILVAVPPDATPAQCAQARAFALKLRARRSRAATSARSRASTPRRPPRNGRLTIFREADAPPAIKTAIED